jgi:hypothetical protein
VSTWRRAYASSLRAQVLGRYGRSCACCGAVGDLTIDHIAGDGREHRIELFGDKDQCGWHFYAWLRRQGFPPGYQVLCRPCGISKGRGERCRLDHGQEAA